MFRVVLSLIFLLVVGCRADGGNYQQFEICEDAVVQVSYLEVLCDSNRTYYYGSNVHRDSDTCDDDDIATITVDFNVTQSLTATYNIFFTMAVYNDQGDAVYELSTTSLCDYAGQSCASQGSYGFTTQVQFESAGGNDGDFSPLVQMAFSAGRDNSSYLGGVNLDWCDSDHIDEYGDEPGGSASVGSSNGSGGYGAIVFVVIGLVALIALAVLLYQPKKAKSRAAQLASKGGARMNQADYGIVLGETPVNEAPLLSAKQQKGSEETESEESDKDGDSDLENTQENDEDDPKKSLKRGQSLLRFLRRKSLAAEEAKK